MKLLGGVVLFDALFAVVHRLLHTKWLYDHVHYVHHKVKAPFSWSAGYASVFETLTGGVVIGTIARMLNMHPLIEWVFTPLVICLTTEIHSGYELPFAFSRVFGGGAPCHEMHHRLVKCNFAPLFSWTDRLMGSYVAPEKIL
jgi:sterol desaturase/sphingolipid hydroxylase (fatty acid hydroxylase superfamily)